MLKQLQHVHRVIAMLKEAQLAQPLLTQEDVTSCLRVQACVCQQNVYATSS